MPKGGLRCIKKKQLEVGKPLLSAVCLLWFFIMSAIPPEIRYHPPPTPPPVAITSYAAAGVAKASPTTTSIEAFKLSIAGFIIPFAFVYHPVLLLEGNVVDFIFYFTLALIGIAAVAASMAGFWLAATPVFIRVALFLSGILIILPDWRLWLVGFVLLIPCIWYQVSLSRKSTRVLMVL